MRISANSDLAGKEIEWYGRDNLEGESYGAGGWYSREIGGVRHAKIIVGAV